MTALTLVAHALTPALRGLVLGGDTEPDPAGLAAARELKTEAARELRGGAARELAGGAGRELAGGADAVFAGPEVAAVRTAEALGLTPVVEPALRDREYGDWSGRGLEELLAADPERVTAWLERPHTATPGGESENDVLTRVADWLGDLDEQYGERRTVVAVVHPAVVRAAVLYVLDAPAESLRHVDVRPLARVRLSLHEGSWSLGLG